MKAAIGLVAGLLLGGLGVWFFSEVPEDKEASEMADAETARYDAEVRQELADRVVEYKEALYAGDVEGAKSFMTRDAWFLFPGMSLRGADLEVFMNEVFPTMTISNVDGRLWELFVHGDIAYGIYEWSETVQMEGESEAETTISNCFTRWKKEDGVWKFDRDVCGPRDAPAEG